ncbi:C45 family autoproteolytic acyltransferase/hydrolase [Phycisphaerales bacterium AB-hyl4]|uniref:C45 family autoproteolytic acyltransferase/hydrolase n=1 Tax=Natronomicrosphaera hydrolytica TaxID=3242702 RepID=A0ABV4U989_9BACT
MRRFRPLALLMSLLAVLTLTLAAPAAHASDELARQLRPFLEIMQSNGPAAATIELQLDDPDIAITAHLARFGDDRWLVHVDHDTYSMHLLRSPDDTRMHLPHRNVTFVGQGPTDPDDHLNGPNLLTRLVSKDSEAFLYLNMLQRADANMAATMLTSFAGVRKANDNTWRSRQLGDASFRFDEHEGNPRLHVTHNGMKLTWTVADPSVIRDRFTAPDDADAIDVSRADLERSLVRGMRRGSEVLAPGPALTRPARQSRRVAHGELRWQNDQRLVTLRGTPEQIGQAHGQLLGPEVLRCVDSVLHIVSLVKSIESGQWVLDELRDIQSRVQPFLPERHERELTALANTVGIDREWVVLANVFPEMFHCSGFAVFGSATADGTLYHGRVLDYMTQIGFEHAMAVFVIQPDDHYDFVNVGYAGFLGSVTGMNEHQISLGEMGGSTLGDWDGVPMATLMRRALEETATLDEVIALWTDSPRTCEFYYVFADGKIPDAVGVAATAHDIEIIRSGQTHPRLGEGIHDTVVLSAGGRLEALRQRVTDSHGRIDEQTALACMDRPVAMRSNLHNVLFIPQQLRLFVSHAQGSQPAAERPYEEYDLAALLGITINPD